MLTKRNNQTNERMNENGSKYETKLNSHQPDMNLVKARPAKLRTKQISKPGRVNENEGRPKPFF